MERTNDVAKLARSLTLLESSVCSFGELNLPAEKAIAYGIHKSRGDIISFLGADDRLFNSQSLDIVKKLFNKKKISFF